MSIINKISNPATELRIQNHKPEKSSAKEGGSFESQFLEMVEKVETMGSEIDAMIEKSSAQNPVSVQHGVHRVGSYIKSMAGIVEDFSAHNTSDSKAALSGMTSYESKNES